MKYKKSLLSFWFVVCSYTRFLQHAKHFGRNTHALFLAFNHHCDGVQVVLERAARTILSMRNVMTDVGCLGEFE
jgi:hypothetical protein